MIRWGKVTRIGGNVKEGGEKTVFSFWFLVFGFWLLLNKRNKWDSLIIQKLITEN
jgi:hypothetical protein